MGSIQILGGVQGLIFKKALCLEASHLMNSQFIQISYYEWLQNNPMYLEFPLRAMSIVQTRKNLAVPNFGRLKNTIWDIWIINFGYWKQFFDMSQHFVNRVLLWAYMSLITYQFADLVGHRKMSQCLRYLELRVLWLSDLWSCAAVAARRTSVKQIILTTHE